ncbi:hypothetical protein GOBAR_AA16647 [Gossypium barbadense]|uniref:Uncharacterized protein n=1 Tax=Gossypium barbadense TaxID=3634 RepID=A0A2P5XKZ1_GOSBA|nr:hypothetical protein GOBAR_AA16647 [Gossypium barbadense]
MATVSLGASFAEAYVMRSLHKEKMKKMKEMEKGQQEAKGDDKVFDERKIPASTDVGGQRRQKSAILVQNGGRSS